MSLYRPKRKVTLRFVVQTLLLAALPSLAGLGMLYFSANSQMQKQAHKELELSYKHFDKIFAIADKVAVDNRFMAHRLCAQILPELRREATRQLYIRSINIIGNNKIYCSSVLENDEEYLKVSPEVQEGGVLVPGNVITPNSSVLYIRHGDIMMAIDGRLLLSFLQSSVSGIRLYFVVGGRELHASGWVYPSTFSEQSIIKSSKETGFSVRASTEPGAEWNIIFGSYLPLFFIFGLTGFVAALFYSKKYFSAELTEKDLRNAISKGEIIPWAQPIFDSSGKEIWGVEILARWKNQEGKVIPPDLFIPLAEKSNIIMELTRSLMMQTKEVFSANINLIPHDFHVSFNISNRCCKTDALVGVCQQWLQGMDNKLSLTLELTERDSFQNSAHFNVLMETLKQHGVKLAIDDFGTAGSNLDYLKEVAFDYIKIDKSYVAGIGSGTSSEHIIDNILDLAQRLGMDVIAEGIENAEQVDHLKGKHVIHFQGYLYSAPVPLETFTLKYFHPLL
ncbi:EAL domain-containing protein [Enterobacter sp. CC120223-11]|uniref:EAL domain-containing protein n=1 Tax=Enterobacter sp. CC120223-11 TaxID=1378073 RepID=UPI000BC4E214|nr:EAL domain-containing protein [Enterobacter sp. CC120223-11]SNY79889.1 EAL domain, c-di-GMP-specific phosphodiesterase class I (or its enzymatically inactive variant) [Enterobacter sp. CC120223-11]